MGRLQEAMETLQNLLKKDPALESIAAQKIEELNKDLAAARNKSTSDNDQKSVSSKANTDDDLAMARIKKGFQEFKSYFKKEQGLFKALAESQNPKFMIIACSDSRVDPALSLGLDFGEAFIVRNIASLVPPKDSSHNTCVGSAIEYAVVYLKVQHLVVIGHSRCGGIKALLGMDDDDQTCNKFSDHIEDWIVLANKASRTAKAKYRVVNSEEQWTCCVKESVNLSLWNSMTYPFVKKAVQSGVLTLHGAYFDFVNGAFEHWPHNNKSIQPETF